MTMRRITLGPISCLLYSCAEALEEISCLIERRTPGQIVTLNALMYNYALGDGALARLVSHAAIVVADSVGITWAARLINNVSAPRTPGIELILDLCARAATRHYSVFLLGSRAGVADKAAAQIQNLFPGIVIAGTHHGFFSASDEGSLFEAIRTARPQILLVGLDIPRQEKWIAENLVNLGVPVIIGVGGSFDVISGDLTRAPRWMQRAGMEWLFRFIQQPWRLVRIKDLPIFVAHILMLKFKVTYYANKS